MYSTEKLFNFFKGKYKKAFKGQAKLLFCIWSDQSKMKRLIHKKKIDGIILTGSDYRIKEIDNRAVLPDIIFKSGIPVLGICYGYQYIIARLGKAEYIKSFENKAYHIYKKSIYIQKPFQIKLHKYFFYHHDFVTKLPKNWKLGAKFRDKIYMAYNKKTKYVGIQFHPERFAKTRKAFFSTWLKYISNA